jgi:hypothetical protein
MTESACEVHMMTGPGAFKAAVRCPGDATATFRRFWVCDEHTVDQWQFVEHQGRLYAWRPGRR